MPMKTLGKLIKNIFWYFVYLFVNFGVAVNLRPMVVIAGSSETQQESQGSFQEFPQVCHLLCSIFI